MKNVLLLLLYFALPLALAGLAIYSAIVGDWSSAGVCALFAVLLAGARALG